MTLYEFLLKTGVDVRSNKSNLGNHLDSEFARRNININFDKEIGDVNETELYEIGRILITSENKEVLFWPDQFIDWMKKLIIKY